MKRPIFFLLLFWSLWGQPFAQDNDSPLLASVDPTYLNKAISRSYNIKTIVIDPGHGGKDSGCLGKNSLEKNIALAISKHVANLIKDAFPQVKVILTRDKDIFIPLHERADIANKNNADLFISVHCNAMENADHIHGSETYVMGLHTAKENLEVAKRENSAILLEDDFKSQYGGYDPNSPEGHIFMEFFQNTHLDYSLLYADKVEKHLGKEGIHRSRGVRQAGFLVLRATAMPSVLVESGYLTNHRDHEFLNSKKGQEHVAQAIFKAFRDYKNEVEGEEKSYVLEPTPATDEILPVAVQEKPKVVPVNTKENPMSTDSQVREVETISTIAESVSFRVQVGAYGQKKDVSKAPWHELSALMVIKEKDIYKYLVGNYDTIDKARKEKERLQENGFAGAFLVAYRGKERIPLQEAL